MEIFTGSKSKVICLVGAGGKKTTMYALSKYLKGNIALTSTTHMYFYDERYVDRLVSVRQGKYPSFLEDDVRVRAYFGPEIGKSRVAGLPESTLKFIWENGSEDYMLIKADGARARLIKAPNEREPLIPSFADTVVPVLSLKVIGKNLTPAVAHRVEHLSAIMGMMPGDRIEPKNLVKLMTSRSGFLKNTEGKRVLPLINMADSVEEVATSVSIAKESLAQTSDYDAVAIGSMKTGTVKEVVYRV